MTYRPGAMADGARGNAAPVEDGREERGAAMATIHKGPFRTRVREDVHTRVSAASGLVAHADEHPVRCARPPGSYGPDGGRLQLLGPRSPRPVCRSEPIAPLAPLRPARRADAMPDSGIVTRPPSGARERDRKPRRVHPAEADNRSIP